MALKESETELQLEERRIRTISKAAEIIANDRLEGRNYELCKLCLAITESMGTLLLGKPPSAKKEYCIEIGGKKELLVETDTSVINEKEGNRYPNCFIEVRDKSSNLVNVISRRSPGYTCNSDINPSLALFYLIKVTNGAVELKPTLRNDR
jgi:hypothetical protein